eukprot:m.85173 g.85173  ORF g.85173 m.85173 type:complete len:578 (+) comp16362_c0_seq9:3162-4895(+)
MCQQGHHRTIASSLCGLASSLFFISSRLTPCKDVKYYPRLVQQWVSKNEQMNRQLVLAVVRMYRMSFNVADDDDPTVLRSFLEAIDKETPLTWSPNVVECFPEPMQKYYTELSATHASQLEALGEFVTAVSLPATQSHAAALFNSANDPGWEDALKYFTSKETVKFFLPAVVYKMLTGATLVPARMLVVMQRIPLSVLGNCVDCAMDYIVCMLMRTGAQFESYFSPLISAIISLTWEHHVLGIGDVIMSLIRSNTVKKESIAVVIRLLDGLLFSDHANNLKTLVAAFCTEMQGTEDPYRTSTWHVQHAFHMRKHTAEYGATSPFSRLGGSDKPNPLFYGSTCMRLLPVLDHVVLWILDCTPESLNHTVRLQQVLDVYGNLFKFHGLPMSTLFVALMVNHPMLATNVEAMKLLVRLYTASPRSSALLLSAPESYQSFIQSPATMSASATEGTDAGTHYFWNSLETGLHARCTAGSASVTCSRDLSLQRVVSWQCCSHHRHCARKRPTFLRYIASLHGLGAADTPTGTYVCTLQMPLKPVVARTKWCAKWCRRCCRSWIERVRRLTLWTVATTKFAILF